MIDGFAVVRKRFLRALAGIPLEDAFRFRENTDLVLTVADGVTRDCKNGAPLTKDLRGLLNARLYYPRSPDPAAVAANIFCESVSRYLGLEGVSGDDAVRSAFGVGNGEIKKWNDVNIPKVNYLANDFASCVAAAGIVDRKRAVFHWGYICDAGIMVVNSRGDLVFKTESDGPDKYEEAIWGKGLLAGRVWSDSDARKTLRKVFRNNPHDEFHGMNSFGVLTGEEEAMEYVFTGSRDLREGDVAAVYTDGLESAIFERGDIRGNVADAVREGNWKEFKRLCSEGVGSEGTVVYARID